MAKNQFLDWVSQKNSSGSKQTTTTGSNTSAAKTTTTTSSTRQSSGNGFTDFVESKRPQGNNFLDWLDDKESYQIDERKGLYDIGSTERRQAVAEHKKAYNESGVRGKYYQASIGWLSGGDDANNPENIQARSDYYAKNVAQVASLKEQIKSAKGDEKKALKKQKAALETELAQYERTQKVSDDYSLLTSKSDFAQKSKKTDYGNPTREELTDYDTRISSGITYDANGVGRDVFGDVYDETYSDRFQQPEVTDRLGLYLGTDEATRQEAYNNPYEGTWDTIIKDGQDGSWEQLTDGEVGVYYYILSTNGKSAADKYLDDMKVELNRRATFERAESINKLMDEGNILQKIALSAASVPANIVGGAIGFAEDTINDITGQGINPYSYAHDMSNFAQDARSATAQKFDDMFNGAEIPIVNFGGDDAYQALMSGVDSLVGAGAFGKGYTVVMGMSAASNEARRLYEQGASSGQIAAGAFLAGAAEMIFEYVSLDKLLSTSSTKGMKQLCKQVLTQAGVEMSEEMFTEIANTVTNSLVMRSQSDWQKLYDEGGFKKAASETVSNVLNAGMGGFVSGGAMAGVNSGLNYLGYNASMTDYGRALYDNGGIHTLVDYGKGSNIGSDVSKQLTKAESALDSGKLSRRDYRTIGKYADSISDSMYENAAKSEISDRLLTENLPNDAKTINAIYDYITNDADIKIASKDVRTLAESIKASETFDSSVAVRTMRERAKLADQYAETVHKMQEEQRIEEEYAEKISDTGKTVDAETGDEIGIKSIASIQDGKMILNTTDGQTIDSNNVEYASGTEALAYETVKSLDVTPHVGDLIVRSMNSSEINPAVFMSDVNLAYNYGLTNQKNRLSSLSIPAEVSKQVYDAGRAAATKNAAKMTEQAKTRKVTSEKKNGVTYVSEINKKSLNETQKTSIKVAEFLAKTTSADIYVYDSSQTGEKANGWFISGTNKIYIDINAGSNYQGLGVFTLGHESGHYIRNWNAAEWQILADAIVEEIDRQAAENPEKPTFEEMVAKKEDMYRRFRDQGRADYANNTDEELHEKAYEDVVCDSLASIMADADTFTEFANQLKETDKTLWDKLKSFIKRFLDRIEATLASFNGVEAEDAAGRAIQNATKETRDQIRELYVRAFLGADANYNEALNNVGIEYDAATESVNPESQVFSERTWTESDYVQAREEAAAEMAKVLGITKKKAMAYIESVNSIAKIIANDRVRLDYVASEGVSSFVGNAEYGGSIDFSTICKKRRLLTGTFTAIQKALPNTALTADEILTIRDMMDKKGYEVSCGLCYVEGSRAKMGEYAKQFLDEYAKTNPEYLPNMAEINTPEGIEKIRIEHPDVYSAYETFMNKLAQRKPKLYQMATAYQGEILNKFKPKNNGDKKKVEEKNRNGGLRLQSFSDFEIIHLIDCMQVIMDMSRVGLAGQAYTKVPDFAYALGNTGLKINLSLIAKGVDENGHLILDEKEGMKKADAKKLRDMYSDNVGTIIVVFDDEQLKAALADDFIDYIIPFHRSQWNSAQYELMGLPTNAKDYTSLQNESYITPVFNSNGKKTRPANYMPNTYWDFSKTGKENAEAYLTMCALNNRKPKFSHLLVNNGDGSYSLQPDGSTDGYWKLLIDFKMYNNDGVGVPQMPVRPDFNMEQAERMLAEYEGGHESFPVAQDVVDEFLATISEERKMSDRDSLGNELTQGQKKYFENSLVRDDNGNLVVVYHGTNKFGFTEFNRTMNFYTDSQSVASSYASSGSDASGIYTGYLNIESPYIVDCNGSKWSAIPVSEELKKMIIDDGGSVFKEKGKWCSSTADIAYAIMGIADETGQYDGLIFKNIEDNGSYGSQGKTSSVFVTFDSSQFKNIDNENPSSSKDIRYSDRDAEVDDFIGKLSIDELIASLRTEVSSTKKAKTERRVDEVNKMLKKIGLEFTGSTKLAWTDDRIEKYLESYAASNPKYAQAYVTYMSPQQFLNLTSGSRTYTIEKIVSESESYGELNMDKIASDVPMFLDIDEDTKKVKVTGHEGRHRMYLLGKAGVEKVPVLLFNYDNKYSKNIRENFTLVPQVFFSGELISKGREVTIERAVPLSNEFKQDVINEFGSGAQDADIRYSDREVVEIPESKYEELKKHFGTTNDFRVAGYLLQDGKMLDFSGKHWGDKTSRTRQVDHRDVNEVLQEENNYDAMIQMIANGNIRLMPEIGGICLSQPPTEKQRLVLRNYIKMFSQYYNDSDGIVVDFDRPGGDTVYSRTYRKGTDTRTILRDIDNYFKNGKQSDLMRFHTADEDVLYSIREEEPPKKTVKGYKVFFVKDGKLYPPMVANPNGMDTPVGVWLNADVGTQAPDSKTGRKQVKAGGKGTQGGSGSLAFRPGWHLGEVPVATQFDRTNPTTGVKDLFPENFVWAECDIAADHDYQEEAMSYGYNANGKFQHSLAGLPKLPVDGYYKYRTNPNPDTVPWLITGAMKVNRLLGDAEVNAILAENGIAPKHRQGGDKTLEELGLGQYEGRVYSDRDYAPTFYSKMSKVIDGIKTEKVGAGGVVPYLKGKGVKDEEIKWSGIQAFLEGKKSVTKKELQDFAELSMIGIVEETLTGSSDEAIMKINRKLEELGIDGISAEYYLDMDEEFSFSALDEDLNEMLENGDITQDQYDAFDDFAGNEIANSDAIAKWGDYVTEGTSNYREILFRIPDSTYTNHAMFTHWDRGGVLAHARIDDITLPDGSNMLFVEEIQSDWHNAGQYEGYKDSTIKRTQEDVLEDYKQTDEFKSMLSKLEDKAKKSGRTLDVIYNELNNPFALFGMEAQDIIRKGNWYGSDVSEKEMETLKKYVEEYRVISRATSGVDDAPFKNGKYIEYVMKRLIRMAAEEGYDYIGWTTGEMQEDRWSSKYAEGYRIEYDQDIPKFMTKYGKPWGAKVEDVSIGGNGGDYMLGINRDDGGWFELYDMDYNLLSSVSFDEIGGEDGTAAEEYFKNDGFRELIESGDSVHAVKITDAMKQSVLYEGQALYSDRDLTTYIKDGHTKDGKTVDFISLILDGKKKGETRDHKSLTRKWVGMAKDGYVYGKVLLGEPYEITRKSPEYKDTYIRGTEYDIKPGESKYYYPILDVEDFRDNPRPIEKNGNYGQYKYSDRDETPEVQEQFENLYGRLYPYTAQYANVEAPTIEEFRGMISSSASPTEVADKYIEAVKAMPNIDMNADGEKQLRNIIVYSKYMKSAFPARLVDFRGEATDARTLLSNALATTAKTAEEKTLIQTYQSQIEVLNKQEAKLAEIKKQIKDISFTAGSDRSKLPELQKQAEKLSKAIATQDKKLLGLESTKDLKAVAEREKALAVKKAKQEGKEALAAYRQRSIDSQRAVVEKYQARIEKSKEGRDKNALKRKIAKKVKELNELLLNGTADKHVPIALQKATAEALQAINMDTVNAEERIAKIREAMNRTKDSSKLEQMQAYIDRIELQNEKMKSRLDALSMAYNEVKKSSDPVLANAFDEDIQQMILDLKEDVGDTPLREMTVDQLQMVYDMYKAVLHTIKTANKAFKAGRTETISELGMEVAREVEVAGGIHEYSVKVLEPIRKFMWNNLKPVYAMRAIGSDTFIDLFDNVRAGEDTWAVDVSEAKQFFSDMAKKYGYKKWKLDGRFEFETKTGKKFSLNLEEIMSLYAYSKRDQAALHLSMGGFVFEDSTTVKKLKGTPINVEVKINKADAHNLSEATLAEIISKLSTEQIAFVDEMQGYMSTVLAAKGNEVSRALYDIDLFKEKNYFPLKSAKQYRHESVEVSGEVKIKNSGFTKKTVKNANNPIILRGFMDVWAGHVNEMAMYHSFTLPLEDFNRVWNYKTPTTDDGDTDSVKEVIQNAYTDAANDYIRQMLVDLNGGTRSGIGADLIGKMTSVFKKGAVFASASVVIQQPSAVARAWAYIDPKYFTKTLAASWNPVQHDKMWNEVKKYAPVAIIKEMGYFDTNMGIQTTDWIKQMDYEGIAEKAKAILKDSDFRDDILSKAPALADELAWVHIWNAVKEQTTATTSLKPGSEEFLEECGKRFTDVVVKTQVYDSVLSRSAMMRSKDTGAKMATAFMAEPTTSINMISDALLQAKRGKSAKQSRKVISAVVSQIILNSILVSLVYAGRDDDDDKTYLEKYVKSLTGSLKDSFNPLSMIPILKDIVSIFQGYEVERSDMQIISDLYKGWKNLFKDNYTPWKKVETFAGAIANMFGVPLKNIMRDVRSLYNIVQSFTSGNETTESGLKYAAIEGLTGTYDSETKHKRLYEAITSGDKTEINRMKQAYGEDKYEQHVVKALRENDARIAEAAQARVDGNVNQYMTIAKAIKAEKHFSQDQIVKAINAEVNAISKDDEENGTSETKHKGFLTSSDIDTAIDNKNYSSISTIEDEMEATHVSNGKSQSDAEKEVDTAIKKAVKEAYYNSSIDRDNAVKILETNAGMEKEDAINRVRYWDFEKNHPEMDIDESVVNKYYSTVAPSGISVDVFYDFYTKQKEFKKQEDILPIIDSLPISSSQKDALWYFKGWSSNTIDKKAPWR